MKRRGWFWDEPWPAAHFFVREVGQAAPSLCGEVTVTADAHLEDVGHTSPDNCAECKRIYFRTGYSPELHGTVDEETRAVPDAPPA